MLRRPVQKCDRKSNTCVFKVKHGVWGNRKWTHGDDCGRVPRPPAPGKANFYMKTQGCTRGFGVSALAPQEIIASRGPCEVPADPCVKSDAVPSRWGGVLDEPVRLQGQLSLWHELTSERDGRSRHDCR